MQPQKNQSNLHAFWRALNEPDRQNFADSAGVSSKYINTHLVYRRKQPRKETIRKLADASDGLLTYDGLVDFFFSN
jgi:predicted transcriptional regulator